jgi:bifunctional non-homologous end joining protein LigD
VPRKRQKPTNKGANVQTERAELYFQQGSSDKVYHLQLENVQDQWSVQAQWGRRGSTLQSDVKVSNTSYEEAKRVYDRVLREKTGKGYQVAQATANGNGAIAVGLPATKELSGHTPELLTPIEEPEALLLAQDASWWFQQKFDGRLSQFKSPRGNIQVSTSSGKSSLLTLAWPSR